MQERDPRNIRIEDFSYHLPDERIAKYPLRERDSSRLVIDDGRSIRSAVYNELPSLLPPFSLLVMNDTKVFHARLLFRKESGARIEVFCLEPEGMDFQQAFASRKGMIWQVLIGNARKWRSGILKTELEAGGRKISLRAERLQGTRDSMRVRLDWDDDGISFGEIVDACGAIPIPPYLNRDSDESDKISYQTTFARQDGSVAAPTAGLHFTPQLLGNLRSAGHQTDFLTLHVGAGTFKPVVTDSIGSHEMHPEHFEVGIDLLRTLRDLPAEKACIAVGTTAVRTLESLYWGGIDYDGEDKLIIDQWRPYAGNDGADATSILDRLIGVMERKGMDKLQGVTRLMVTPGYRFRIVDGMLTNFHQPRSTLLLLVAAMAGERWKEVYSHALENDFRFLSYGDSCLFLPR